MAAAAALRQFMIEDNITGWDPKWEKGLMKQLIVKTGFRTGEVMVILTINGKGIPNMQKLAEMLDDAVYEAGYSLESIVLRNLKGEDTVAAGEKRDTGSDRGSDFRNISGQLLSGQSSSDGAAL